MTYRDLVKLGLPFVISGWVNYPHEDGSVSYHPERDDALFYDSTKEQIASGVEWGMHVISEDDWFEEENPAVIVQSVITKECTCDFYTVVLRTGCKCGGA